MNLPPNILALLNPIEERLNATGGVERWMRTMQERWTTRDVDPPLKPYKVFERGWVNLDTGEVEWREV